MADNSDSPRDPVVYLLWRAWRAISPDRPAVVSLHLEEAPMPDITLKVDQARRYRLRGRDASGNVVDPPPPVSFTSADPSILQVVPNEAEATLVGKAPGDVTLVVKAGELIRDYHVRVESVAVSIELIEVDPPAPA